MSTTVLSIYAIARSLRFEFLTDLFFYRLNNLKKSCKKILLSMYTVQHPCQQNDIRSLEKHFQTRNQFVAS